MLSKTSFFFLILLAACAHGDGVQGLWKWTWSGDFDAGNTNLAIAFNGWVDPATALSSSNINTPGERYISLGGGNGNGHWSAGSLSSISQHCSGRQFSGFSGIAFDIEEGDGGLAGAFIGTINTCKNAGYKILITVSHSTPYGIPDGSAVMQAFFSNAGLIDYMSPQLYTSGAESSNDFTANGVSWQQYAPFSGKLIPSIVSEGLYQDASNYFGGLGIRTVGFVQWAQQRINSSPQSLPTNGGHSNPPPPPPPPAQNNQGNQGNSPYRCGGSWTAAICGQSCPSGTDRDCPSGQHCFANLPGCNNPPPPPPPPPVWNPPPPPPPAHNNGGCPKARGGSVRCGSDWVSSNNQCGCACATNGDCPSGQYCWAGMNPGACGGNAVDSSSNTYSGSNTSSGLEPAAIGIIVAGVVVGVVMIVVAIAMIVSANKRVEKA